MLPTAGPKLPARLRAPLATLALLSCVACTSTDRLRIEAGDPLGADFVYVIVDAKKIETNFESDANEAPSTSSSTARPSSSTWASCSRTARPTASRS